MMVIKKSSNVGEILYRLKKEYKQTGPFLNWSNPLELLVATALSAQCTDKRVNIVTKKLFKRYVSADDYAVAGIKDLEKDVYSTGFYRNKAKNLKGMGQMLVREFDGVVPEDFLLLQTLPGIGKKTAAIIMSKVFGQHVSTAVDTHVFRISRLLGIVSGDTIEKVRRELNEIVPREEYLRFNEYLITHGRAVCVARRPQCCDCILNDICASKDCVS